MATLWRCSSNATATAAVAPVAVAAAIAPAAVAPTSAAAIATAAVAAAIAAAIAAAAVAAPALPSGPCTTALCGLTQLVPRRELFLGEDLTFVWNFTGYRPPQAYISSPQAALRETPARAFTSHTNMSRPPPARTTSALLGGASTRR